MKDMLEIEIIACAALDAVHGGAGAMRTTVRAPLSGPTTVKQNIQAPFNKVTVNPPKGPVSMQWGAKTWWGDFSWSFSMGK